jgi:signal transduction histidine kinase
MSSGNFEFLLVFFIYGLAFFCMGLIMLIESRRSSVLGEARLLIPLAVFGFIHGTHEWVEMFLEFRNLLGLPVPSAANWGRLVLLVASFSFLLLFALQALKPQRPRLPGRAVYTAAGLLVITVVMVVIVGLAQKETPGEWGRHTDALARYLLAVPAAALAAFGLIRQSRESRHAGRRQIATGMLVAGLSFGLYSLTQTVVSPANIFPARYINTVVFSEWLGIPIQGVRAVVAVLATLGLMRAIQAAEDDRRRQLVSAQQDRLEALQLIQRDLEEREIMRRELLRHTVITQEDERRRIARELHDETSQYLTALSLNMAALRNTLPKNKQAGEILERLQELTRRMSQGIYNMVHDLRPAQLDDLGLAAALQYLADDAQRRSGLLVSLQIQGTPRRLDPLVETVLFRVAQEALNNAARHSQSDNASLQLDFGFNEVRLKVQDQGVGFDPDAHLVPPRGWGIAGMRERAESMRGNLRLQSAPGTGTLVEVTLPVSANDSFHII